MTEDQAIAWVEDRYGHSPGVIARLKQFEALVRVENDQQNLIAASTFDQFWSRHLVDSLQLLAFGPGQGHWIDVGSGAGFPGIVIAAASDYAVTLIEPRRLRAAFLEHTASALGVSDRVRVIASKAQNAISAPGEVISARAVATLSALLAATSHLRTPSTRYVLPKGRSALEEVDRARNEWQGVFHVEQSVVDPESGIVIASGVRRR